MRSLPGGTYAHLKGCCANQAQAASRQLLLHRLKRLLLVLYLLHPCARGIPFILNITHRSFSHERVSSFRNHCLLIYAQSRGYAVPYLRTVRGRKPSIERHMDVLGRSLRPRHTVLPEHKRVLKEGTAYPLLPRKFTDCWFTGYLE